MIHRGRFSNLLWPLMFLCTLLSMSFNAASADATQNLGVQAYEDTPGVDVVLLSVKRTTGPPSLTLKWAYRNNTNEPKILGQNFTGMGSSEVYSLVWDLYVTAGNTKYAVLRDSSNLPVAGKHGANKAFVLAPKRTYATWAKVLDPGKDVGKVTVFIPGAPPFEDVAISP